MRGATETLSPALPTDIEDEASTLLKAACAKNLKLATAESCTGGLLAALLTDVEGCGHAFDRGFVVYSVEAKCELLSVKREMVDNCGAVSRDVAEAMALGALTASAADVVLAVTGFAGAAGEDDEPGLVHLAVACRQGGLTAREEHLGDVGRGEVRLRTLRTALEMMDQAVASHEG